MNTIQEAKQYLRANFEQGVSCPCCGQLVKLYKRKFNSGMARCLIHIYQVHKTKPVNDQWIKISTEVLARGINPTNMEYSKLAHWGLIEERGDEGKNTPSSGYWRVTPTGEAFVIGLGQIPSHVFIYDNKIRGFSDTQITIQQALGRHFNYDELMKGE